MIGSRTLWIAACGLVMSLVALTPDEAQAGRKRRCCRAVTACCQPMAAPCGAAPCGVGACAPVGYATGACATGACAPAGYVTGACAGGACAPAAIGVAPGGAAYGTPGTYEAAPPPPQPVR